MAILLTGFEPFNGAEINPSWEAVQLVPEEIDGHRVHRMQLPVVYGEAAEMLLAEIWRLKPVAVLSCGVAGGRKGVTPELVALNYRMAKIADNKGKKYEGERIEMVGETALMTDLPLQQMANDIREADIPAEVSLSAGAYVCNDVYYALLRHQAEEGYKGLFVHVPEESVVSFEDAARALTLCARWMLKTE